MYYFTQIKCIMNKTSFSKMSMLTVAVVTAGPLNIFAQANDPVHSPSELVDALHTAFGDHHSRAVHAKGIILEGEFVPDKRAAAITSAFHLQQARSKVTVRFS